MGAGGALYVVHPRRRPLGLPGVTIYPRGGPGPVQGDMPLPDGLWISSTERALLDNLVRAGERTLDRPKLEAWIERLLQHRGENGLNTLRGGARQIAGQLRRGPQMRVLDGLISAALTTKTDIELQSRQLRARSAGYPYDEHPVQAFTDLVATLRDQSPDTLPDLPQQSARRRLLPFYEAYFSNFIEGTEFTVDEAADIVFSHRMPPGRPEDAHDVLGTYQIVGDLADMRTTPRTPERLLELLKLRHAVLMGGRPDKNPGIFKTRANRAGQTEFVSPALVEGTLRRGFTLAEELLDPFSRAVFMMFLVAEVHPFDDGNGRIARIMMNAELVAMGEVRIVVPVVYRANYLAALKGANHNGSYPALLRMLAFVRRYTARIDFSSRESAEADLIRTHAFTDALEAESSGIKLTLP